MSCRGWEGWSPTPSRPGGSDENAKADPRVGPSEYQTSVWDREAWEAVLPISCVWGGPRLGQRKMSR